VDAWKLFSSVAQIRAMIKSFGRSFGTEIDRSSMTRWMAGRREVVSNRALTPPPRSAGPKTEQRTRLVVRRCRLGVGEAINTRARAHRRAHPSSLHSSSEAFCKIGCETRWRIGLRSAPARRRPLSCRRELEVSAKPLRSSRIQLPDPPARAASSTLPCYRATPRRLEHR